MNAWVSDVVLGMDGRTAWQPVLNIYFWSRCRIPPGMVGELGRRGGVVQHLMYWGGCLFIVVVPRLRACRGFARGVARGDNNCADMPISDHAKSCRGQVGSRRWCRGELRESSAGDGRWAYSWQVLLVECLATRQGRNDCRKRGAKWCAVNTLIEWLGWAQVVEDRLVGCWLLYWAFPWLLTWWGGSAWKLVLNQVLGDAFC